MTLMKDSTYIISTILKIYSDMEKEIGRNEKICCEFTDFFEP